MTHSESKTFFLGAAAGLAAAGIAIAVLALPHVRAARESTPQAAATEAPQRSSFDTAATQPGAAVTLSPEEITAAGVQVEEAHKARLETGFEAFGRVEESEAQLSRISARISGRVDNLYLQYTGQPVRRGAAVAELYSPEVASGIEEYRLAQGNRSRLGESADPEAVAAADALIAASRRRLELWGISASQIDAPRAAGTPHITIYSSASGTVVERKVLRGQYVAAGETLFTVADLSTVWVKADVYEVQLPQVSPGQAVAITAEALPGQIIRGQVEFIEPNTNPQTRTVPVHIHLSNPGLKLLPGMFVRADFTTARPVEKLIVPRSAVIDTGTRKMVYLARPNGVFEAREVMVGIPSEDAYPVLGGLTEGDKVVVNGTFLIDSQTRLTSGLSGMFGGSKQFSNPPPGTGAAPATAGANAAISFSVEPNPPKGAAGNMFRVSLTDVAGKPIPDADVKVTLVMPAMPSMSMPEMRQSFALPYAGGVYVGRGNIPAAGAWNITVEATRGGQSIATFHTHVRAQ